MAESSGFGIPDYPVHADSAPSESIGLGCGWNFQPSPPGVGCDDTTIRVGRTESCKVTSTDPLGTGYAHQVTRWSNTLIGEYLAYCEDVRRLSPNTMRVYRAALTSYAEHLTSRKTTALNATREDVISWLVSMRDVAPRTLRQRHSIASGFHAYLVDNGDRRGNPVRLVPRARLTDFDRRVPTIAEVETCRALAGELVDRAAIALLYDCALRLEEATELRCHDVCVERWIITLVGKRGRRRKVPIVGARARATIAEQLLAVGNHGHVLQPPTRRIAPRYHPESIRRRLRHVALSAVGWDILPHDLRHARAEHLRAGDLDEFAIAKFLGHASIQQTATYVHPDDVAAAVARATRLHRLGAVRGPSASA